jgi:ABC-type dipeptide/oligopeptide/nickel transport system ATPase component
MIMGPGIAIMLTGISFNVLGESLASGIDPRNRIYVAKQRKTSGTTRKPAISVRSEAPRLSALDHAGEAIGISNLHVFAGSSQGGLDLVKGLSLSIREGERVGIVGESGSGKSLTLSALAHLLPGGVGAESDSHRFFGEEVGSLSAEARRRLLGERLAMVFQDPMSTLNPALKVKSIMLDKLSPEQRKDRKRARQLLVQALEQVGISDAEQKLDRHPHELSGGQRQRVMIAIALLGRTKVLLADEPTTALDVSVQAQIMRLLRDVSREQSMSLVLVSHDLALVSQLCERIVVMYGGRIVEDGTTEQILTAPQHPYTRLLLSSVPARSDDLPGESELAMSKAERN